MAQYQITFETKCDEEDWEIMLKTDRIKQMIDYNTYDFAERILYIGHVNDVKTVSEYAQILVDQGVLTSFVLVHDYAEEALRYFQMDPAGMDSRDDSSIQKLVGIYMCKTEYLLHFSMDSIPCSPYDWIPSGIISLNSDLGIKVCNPMRNDEAEKEAIRETDKFSIGYGIDDHCYLVRTRDFKDNIYHERHYDLKEKASYGGGSFGNRVDAWMRIHDYHRVAFKQERYSSKDCQAAECTKESKTIQLEGIKLSILIPSLPERIQELTRIVEDLHNQSQNKPVEILVLLENRKRTTGEKRNMLIEQAKGHFVAFVDDDDRVVPHYVDTLLRYIDENPQADCIVFEVSVSLNGQYLANSKHSKDYVYGQDANYYYRKPNHIMCYAKRIAAQEKFMPISYWEDDEWAERTSRRIVTEVSIPEALYYYDWIEKPQTWFTK